MLIVSGTVPAGCGASDPCPLTTFLNITSAYIPGDWDAECGNTDHGGITLSSSKSTLVHCTC